MVWRINRSAILTAFALRGELRSCNYYLQTLNEAIKTSIMDFRPNPTVLTEFLDRSAIVFVDECNQIQGQHGLAKVGVTCSATKIFSHLLLRRLQIQVPETQEYLSKLASRPSETSAINGLSDRNLYLILFDLKNSPRVLLVSVELPAELRKEIS